jgi:hypothetical protein
MLPFTCSSFFIVRCGLERRARTLTWATFRTAFDFYASELRRGCSASKPWPTRDGGSEI